MHTIVQAVVLGVLTGAIYALMSSGLTLVFGIMRVINVAQGALVILAAYVSYELFSHVGIDPFLSILILIPAMFALGVAAQLVFIRSLRGDYAAEMSLLVTWALALGLEGLMSIAFSTTDRTTLTSYADKSWTVAGYQFSEPRVMAFGVAVLLLAALYALLRYTKFGRSIRAVVQNRASAQLLGIDPDRVSALGFGVGASTAAAAGAVYGVVYPFNPGSHYDLISRLLSIIVLGGLGSIGGAVVGALIVSVSSAVVASTISPTWSEMTFFVILLAVLLLRPRGLFGSAARGAM
jgi:branched-chain amino acid transport system permease protein